MNKPKTHDDKNNRNILIESAQNNSQRIIEYIITLKNIKIALFIELFTIIIHLCLNDMKKTPTLSIQTIFTI